MSTLNFPSDSTFFDAYGLIRASGPDARQFLQSQLTNDLTLLTPEQPLRAAWCNAKGRVQAIFHLFERADGIYLRLPQVLMPLTLPRLKMFVLRAKVVLEEVNAAAIEPPLPAQPDRLARIRAGMPEIWPATREAFTPQMLNLDQLGAISFRKGCYPGQEIVAKSHYRGLVKRRLFIFRLPSGPISLPEPGSVLRIPGEPESAGEIVDAVYHDGALWFGAVVKLDTDFQQLRLPSAPTQALEIMLSPKTDA